MLCRLFKIKNKVINDMKLSTHFKLKEVTKSETAVRKGIDNTP